MRGKNKQVIGAIWSSQSASDWRGFGKSMLMAEESKLICRDFGASFLTKKGATEKDIGEATTCMLDVESINVGQVVAILHAKARLSLKHAGNNGTE